jgi:hypothetical protein
MRLLLYVNLNKLRFYLLHKSRLLAIYIGLLSYRVIGIWITQRKKEKEKKVNVVRYNFEIIVKKLNKPKGLKL